MSPLFTILFAAGAALFYMAASWIMQAWGVSPYLLLVPIVLVTLAAGAWLETEVLRWSRLGYVLVLALALEVLTAFAVALAMLGEAYSGREIAGALVVFTGIALLGMPSGSTSE